VTRPHLAKRGKPDHDHDALRTILPLAGWGEERARAVEITGGTDPIVPTPFRIGETSAAALRVLGVPEDREAVRQAVAQWDALELEESTG